MDNLYVEEQLKKDVELIQDITIIPSLLNIICRVTNMRFAAVARVTEQRWITCSAHDEINFGLKPGDELKIETTICHEIRQSHQPVVIDNVLEDDEFCHHHHLPCMVLKVIFQYRYLRKMAVFLEHCAPLTPCLTS